MRININLILNKKHALKAHLRYKGSKKTIVDLNNELMLGWKLCKAKIYPQVKIKNLRITKYFGVPKWKLVSEFKNTFEDKKRSFFLNNKSFINFLPSTTYTYNQNRTCSRFYGYRLGVKGRFSSFALRYNNIRRKKFLIQGKDEKFLAKLNFLGLNLTQTKVTFFASQPKTTFYKLKIYTVYNRRKRKIFIKFKNLFRLDKHFNKKVFIEGKSEPIKSLIERFDLKKKLEKLNLK